jgi:hypothetical protein
VTKESSESLISIVEALRFTDLILSISVVDESDMVGTPVAWNPVRFSKEFPEEVRLDWSAMFIVELAIVEELSRINFAVWVRLISPKVPPPFRISVELLRVIEPVPLTTIPFVSMHWTPVSVSGVVMANGKQFETGGDDASLHRRLLLWGNNIPVGEIPIVEMMRMKQTSKDAKIFLNKGCVPFQTATNLDFSAEEI